MGRMDVHRDWAEIIYECTETALTRPRGSAQRRASALGLMEACKDEVEAARSTTRVKINFQVAPKMALSNVGPWSQEIDT